ncbi:MAG: pitrilysin family protein [Candidatus Accumulibacter phosphatis]|jgi:zinc protease|uniref:Peptidase M16 inactive domain protein n=2 Tax=Candidatus Accumulibacter TaxID=327159 RepID=A0A080LW82_9PROT|nr:MULTISPECIES: pitrilysin family protein [Candidatus Accumulibacter]KFB72000.1 MAG: Peptidase M16 inactive domain protein [Candidatus Accumulibacter phosphatis]NMQ06492.1 insulinase family protein [Candidatus Accumulibacter contiguus]HRF13286.1 pitrilysin family protein [Candidatus Accumulibacter phosphatis]
MNPCKLLICLCLVLAMPMAHAGPRIERWQTTSGAGVLFVENHSLPILDVQVDFAAGTAHEAEGKEGVASLTRALVDLGVAGMDEMQIASRMADLGARLSGGVDMDRASVALRTLSMADKRGPALDMLRAILSTPQFPAAVFDREQARSIATLKEALTRPEAIASRAFWAAIYGAHPYGRHATPESVAALVRADVVAFHAANYTAQRARVTIVGDLSRDEAESVAEALTVALPSGPLPAEIAVPELPAAGERRIDHPAVQAHLLVGLPALKRGDPDFFPLAVGNYSLGGGGFVSRLMKEVRDKRGLAYSVHSYFLPLQQLGPFQMGLQTKKTQADDALKVAREVLASFLEQGPTETELQAAKQNLIGSFPLRLDSNRKLLENVAMIGFYGLPLDYLDRYPENIEKVTVADIKAAFARHLRPEHLVTVVVAGAGE